MQDELGSIAQATLRQLGVADLNSLDSPQRYPWDEIINFSDAIAAGANSGTKGHQISTAWAFCCTEVALQIWNSSAYLTDVDIGAPACWESAPDSASEINDMFFRNAFDISIKAGSLDFFSKQANCSLVTGTTARPAVEGPHRWRWMAPGSPIETVLYNNHASAIVKAQLVLKGFRVLAKPRGK